MNKTFKREVRSLDMKLEVRAADNDQMVLEGHAAVFDKPADLYWFSETIARGAFLKSIEEDDIRALLNHDSNLVLGRNMSGTLALDEDDVGLHVVIYLPDTQIGRDTHKSVQRGDITQMSFMFDAVRVEWEKKEDDKEYRKVLEAKLYDVSVVTFPAYEQTDINARGYRSTEKVYNDRQDAVECPTEGRTNGSSLQNSNKDDECPTEGRTNAEGEGARVRMNTRKRRLDILSSEGRF